MSRLLLRKALDLCEDEDKKKESSANSHGKRRQVKRSGSGVEFKKVSSTKRKHRRKERTKIKDSIEDLQMKCVLDDVKKRKDADLTIDNISMLQSISQQCTIESVPIDNILMHQKGRLAKDLQTVTKKQPKEKSMFSEEDFEKFEKEYFVKL